MLTWYTRWNFYQISRIYFTYPFICILHNPSGGESTKSICEEEALQIRKAWKVISQTFRLSHSKWTDQILHGHLNQVATTRSSLLLRGVTLDAYHHPAVSWDGSQCVTKLMAKPYRITAKIIYFPHRKVLLFALVLLWKCSNSSDKTTAAATFMLITLAAAITYSS